MKIIIFLFCFILSSNSFAWIGYLRGTDAKTGEACGLKYSNFGGSFKYFGAETNMNSSGYPLSVNQIKDTDVYSRDDYFETYYEYVKVFSITKKSLYVTVGDWTPVSYKEEIYYTEYPKASYDNLTLVKVVNCENLR